MRIVVLVGMLCWTAGICAGAPSGPVREVVETLGGVEIVGGALPGYGEELPVGLRLSMAGGVSFGVELTGVARGTSAGWSGWEGEVTGEEGSQVVVVRGGGCVLLWVWSHELGQIEIEGLDGGGLVARRLRLEEGFCGVEGEGVKAGKGKEVAGGEKAGPVIDVLVVYTGHAKATVGGARQVEAKANAMVASLNGVLERSRADAEVRLVGTVEIDYSGAGAANDGSLPTLFARLRNGADGFLDDVPGLRNLYGADLVCLFAEEASPSVLGQASIDGPWSVAHVATASGVMPHELGHNLGCGHNDTGSGQARLAGKYGYSSAHFFNHDGTQRGTIMSYIGQRFGHFSNPRVDWNGHATGTATRDHARTISTNAARVAGFRAEVTGDDFDGDGVLNVDEPAGDFDGDGLPNERDADADGDGVDDGDEVAAGRDAYDGLFLFSWDRTGDFEGWSAQLVTAAAVRGGRLTGRAETNDPKLERGGLRISGDRVKVVLVRMRSSSTNDRADLFWGNEDGPPTAERMARASWAELGSEAWLVFDMEGEAEWRGHTIMELRFDPVAKAGSTFLIDSLRASDGDWDDDGISDVEEGGEDVDGDGLANFEDTDSDGDGQSDEVEVLAGSDPLDRGSVFEVASVQKEGRVRLRVSGKAGRRYRLERSGNLEGGWTAVATTAVRGADGTVVLDDVSPPEGQSFYRVVVFR